MTTYTINIKHPDVTKLSFKLAANDAKAIVSMIQPNLKVDSTVEIGEDFL